MAKLGATNPLTGNKMDLSLKGIGGLLVGGVVLWGIVATSQNIGKIATNKLNNKYVDFVPESMASGEVKIVDQVARYG